MGLIAMNMLIFAEWLPPLRAVNRTDRAAAGVSRLSRDGGQTRRSGGFKHLIGTLTLHPTSRTTH